MSPGTMRAVTVDEFGPPQNLRITPRPVPEPGPDEISIDVAFAGVGFVDTLFRDPGRAPRECTDVLLAADLDHQLPRLTADGLVDVVIDPVGSPQRTTAFGHVAPFGRHVVLGNASGDDQPFSGDQAWLGSRVVAGLSVGGVAHLRPAAVTRALSAVITLVARGILSGPRPAVEPLEQAAAVHQAIADRRAPAKTVLSIAP